MSSAMIVTGTEPDGYDGGADEAARGIANCVTCDEPFWEDKGYRMDGETFCSRYCARRREETVAILVKPAPPGVRIAGFDI